MNAFSEYQSVAGEIAASLRNNRDRILIPVQGLQQEAGKIGSLLTAAVSSGKLSLSQAQADEMKNRLGDILWFLAILCRETGLEMQDVATHSIAQLQDRARHLDSDLR